MYRLKRMISLITLCVVILSFFGTVSHAEEIELTAKAAILVEMETARFCMKRLTCNGRLPVQQNHDRTCSP